MIPTHLWRDLISGQKKSWTDPSTIHRRQYDRWIGCHRHLGIELETRQDITPEQWAVLSAYKGMMSNYSIERSHNKELQVLWDITSPITWTNNVRSFVDIIRKAGIPTVGSVHVNIQYLSNTKFAGYSHGDILGKLDFNTYRAECKYGPSFLTYEEFMSNLIVCAINFPNNGGRTLEAAKELDPIVPDGICIQKPTVYAENMIKWYLSC